MSNSSIEESRSSSFFESAYESSFEYSPNGIPESSEQNDDVYMSGESNSVLELSSNADVAGLYSMQNIKELSHAQLQQMLIRKSNVLIYDIMGRALSVTGVETITMQSGLYLVLINGERFSYSHIK